MSPESSGNGSDAVHRSWEEAVSWLREQPEQDQLVRDCYYDQPPLAAAERYRQSEEWREVCRLLPAAGGRALDVGAGHGITTYALTRHGWRVTSIEPDSGEIVGRDAIRRLMGEAGLAAEIREGTGESLPVHDAEFDLVLARQVVHHARDLHAMSREFHRVLRPGGMLLTLRDHVISDSSQMPEFLEQHPLHRLYGGEHAFRLAEYRDALASAGFRVLRTIRGFDSAINYAPYTRETLQVELLSRIAHVPFAKALLRPVLRNPFGLRCVLRTLSWVDRRPGRLVSFVCEKRARV